MIAAKACQFLEEESVVLRRRIRRRGLIGVRAPSLCAVDAPAVRVLRRPRRRKPQRAPGSLGPADDAPSRLAARANLESAERAAGAVPMAITFGVTMRREARKLGMRVQELRVKQRMTQEELAVKARFSRGYLARLETGRHEPTLTILRRLTKALGVPVTELLS